MLVMLMCVSPVLCHELIIPVCYLIPPLCIPFYSAPEWFDPDWMSKLKRDISGNYRLKVLVNSSGFTVGGQLSPLHDKNSA